jgi:hypothetical protein
MITITINKKSGKGLQKIIQINFDSKFRDKFVSDTDQTKITINPNNPNATQDKKNKKLK